MRRRFGGGPSIALAAGSNWRRCHRSPRATAPHATAGPSSMMSDAGAKSAGAPAPRRPTHVAPAAPPPLLAEHAVARRQAQLTLRLAGFALFRSGQDPVMAADNLFL